MKCVRESPDSPRSGVAIPRPGRSDFRLDVEYVDNRSMALDMKILFQTIRTVMMREGISQEGHATMPPPPFEGYVEDVRIGGPE